tara:strand:+ start:19209 stop:20606 length:1398 start_codon:yes stop_codon:yes gene_type:complete
VNEQTVIEQTLANENYARKIIPFIDLEYFETFSSKWILQRVINFVEKYNKIPTKDVLDIELESDKLTETQYKEVSVFLTKQATVHPQEEEWLVDQTEKWFQERAVYNGIMKSISILDGNSEENKGSIPAILSDALGVCFDTNIGHDFLEDSDERYESYRRIEEKLPFDLEHFNKITKGGLSRKSLNVILAGTGVGKTLAMCHFAAANLVQGKNVLYITMEMAEERIAERIDANLLDIPINELPDFPKKIYEEKIDKLRVKTKGHLIIKEYPTASVHSGHFRHLLSELKVKKKFKPDIIYVDYLNICGSSRLKNNITNSYMYVKSIAEELRGLAVEANLPIVTATQVNRSGFTNSDPGLEDTSESFGLPATADFMFAMITNEALDDLGQIAIKQLKNRYNDPSLHRKFVVGVDRTRMRLSDCDQEEQKKDTPIMNGTTFGERQDEDDKMKFVTKVAGRKDFSKLFT